MVDNNVMLNFRRKYLKRFANNDSKPQIIYIKCVYE